MTQQKTYAITGATGFVGSAVLERLAAQAGVEIRALVRRVGVKLPGNTVAVQVGEDFLLEGDQPLEGVDVLVHCAARVHIMSDASSDPLSEYRSVNVAGTLKLAESAARSGVKRFIFISSIKVNGEGTVPGKPYTADDMPAPVDAYGISKMEAEQRLMLLGNATGMEIVIIRPVLVYGPGVKANFRSMMSWLNKGVPLPLGAIPNQRSLVALDNLVDLVVTCLDHAAAANQTFLVSDDDDMSTTELLKRMGEALQTPVRLIPVPAWLLLRGAALLGRKDVARRLCGSLQVDISKTRSLLGWTPPLTVAQALSKTARSFQESLKSK
ncbi:UDP-glucose 4-epimerase family protein [Pseudomonas sp. Env-44]|uniref:UDP-glucose 4-epimerase family protein n=1 Tax=unclassified Pseudomonas TaxID=196821 RepID=UPI000CD3BC1C|nr:SDR family oxidoreductase [Pseudomonas sp. 770NI]MBJ2235117.1 SDR family oxidoreductase [Pseudomonas fluorescens]POH41552.1 NAD-dependent dehydratase [Pseudomonas fluorescens]PRW67248.1 NAD-dependent dehydratase [Pseudomonas fluorescens]RZI21089.1 SDR family oxidoreductase [Pseudomonas sp. 770NI]